MQSSRAVHGGGVECNGGGPGGRVIHVTHGPERDSSLQEHPENNPCMSYSGNKTLLGRVSREDWIIRPKISSNSLNQPACTEA